MVHLKKKYINKKKNDIFIEIKRLKKNTCRNFFSFLNRQMCRMREINKFESNTKNTFGNYSF